MSEMDMSAIAVILGIVLAALGGFMMGFVLADNRRKADDAFNPKLRPDQHHERV